MNWGKSKNNIISIGIIGAGYAASVHSKVLKSIDPIIEQVIFDVNKDAAQKFSSEYCCQFAETLDNLFDVVDAVIIATPVWTHYKLVLEAIRRKKHVLCEKPMAQSLHEAEEMYSMCDDANLICAVGFNYRFFDITKCMLNEIANEPIQEIHLSIRRLFRNDWKRDESSVISDLGIHLLDLLTFFSGGLVDTARCDTVMKFINTCDYDSVVKGCTDNDVPFVLEAARIDNPQDVCFCIQIKYNNKVLKYDSRKMWVYTILDGNDMCEKKIAKHADYSDFFDFYDSILKQDKEWLMMLSGKNSSVLASFRDGYLAQISLERLLLSTDTR